MQDTHPPGLEGQQRDGIPGRIALVAGHCAGLMDIVSLPVWVGMVLIGQLGLQPQLAGALATLFLAAVVLSSLCFAPRLNRLRRERITPTAYALAGLCFAGMMFSRDYAALAGLHAVAGLAVGCGLSMTHGTMGASTNPHRLAAIAFTALAVLAIAFFGVLPPLVQRLGANAFFATMAGVMGVAALCTLIAFPAHWKLAPPSQAGVRLPSQVWFGMAGVSLMTLNHAMVFGFIERIGGWHGYTAAQIGLVLVVSGIANLFPSALAGLLDRRWSATAVVCIGPLVQAAAGLLVTQGNSFSMYVISASLLISVLAFTHIFAFGLLARQDPTGRVVASSPVMIMTGSAGGPLLGGVLAQHLGYGSLGWAALAIGLLAAVSFRLGARDKSSATPVHATATTQGRAHG